MTVWDIAPPPIGTSDPELCRAAGATCAAATTTDAVDRTGTDRSAERSEDGAIAARYRRTTAAVAEPREIFSVVDADDGGTIDCDELGRLYSLLGTHREEWEVRRSLREMIDGGAGGRGDEDDDEDDDVDDDRELSFGQFARSVWKDDAATNTDTNTDTDTNANSPSWRPPPRTQYRVVAEGG